MGSTCGSATSCNLPIETEFVAMLIDEAAVLVVRGICWGAVVESHRVALGNVMCLTAKADDAYELG